MGPIRASPARTYTYDYDRYGNRWGQTVTAGSGYNTQLSFNSSTNRVTTAGFTYDTSGNITDTGPSPTFSYDQENFMLTVGSNTYKYDAKGRRVRKTISGTVTEYFYSGSVVVSEKQGSTWMDYIFFGSQRIAKQTGSTASTATYIHTDHLGSTRVCTDGSGNANGTCDGVYPERSRREPFGEYQPPSVSSCSALPTNYRFAGAEFDSESGLYHTWFRQYDASQGRWMSADPIPGSESDPQSQDRYTYVADDPANFIDPLGLSHCTEECVTSCVRPIDGGPPRCHTSCRFVCGTPPSLPPATSRGLPAFWAERFMLIQLRMERRSGGLELPGQVRRPGETFVQCWNRAAGETLGAFGLPSDYQIATELGAALAGTIGIAVSVKTVPYLGGWARLSSLTGKLLFGPGNPAAAVAFRTAGQALAVIGAAELGLRTGSALVCIQSPSE